MISASIQVIQTSSQVIHFQFIIVLLFQLNYIERVALVPERVLVLLEYLGDGRFVALMKRIDLFFRGIFRAVDTYGFSNDEVLRLALVRQEAVYRPYRFLGCSSTICR